MLVPSVCPVFPRSRWVGGELSINWCGILASFHNLLKPLLARWGGLSGVPTSGQSKPQLSLQAYLPGWNLVAAQEAQAQSGPAAADAAEGWADSVDYDPLLAADAERDLLDRATGNLDWAKLNTSMRLRCGRWGQHEHATVSLVAMKHCMMPCLFLTHSLLRQAGLRWERSQQALVATGQPRDYRVLAGPRLTKETLGLISKKLHEALPAVPTRDCTRRTRTLLFRLLSTAGCAVQALFQTDTGYPFRLFKLAMDGSVEKVFDDPPCLYDELTAKLLLKYPSPAELQSFEATAVIFALAETLSFDIAGVEARHAAARRINCIRSNQTNTVSFETLTSLVCTRSLVKNRSDWLEARGRAPQLKKKHSFARDRTKKRSYRRGGGAWRAFQHLQKVAFGSQKSVSADYRRVKQAGGQEWANLQALGKMGTRSSRAGSASFGARVRTDRTAGRGVLSVTAGMPSSLAKEIRNAVDDVKRQKAQDQVVWSQEIDSLAAHSAQSCKRLEAPDAQPRLDPGPALAKPLASCILPVGGSMLSVECLPPAAEVAKD